MERMTREDFEEKLRSKSMYGPDLTEEEIDRLFQAYSNCAKMSPDHISKNKASGKHRKRKKKTAETDQSGS